LKKNWICLRESEDLPFTNHPHSIMENLAGGSSALAQAEPIKNDTSHLQLLIMEVKQLRKEVAERDAQAAEREDRLRKEAADREDRLRADFAAMLLPPTESPSATTYATVGSTALSDLVAEGRIAQAVPPPEGASAEELEPIASPADLAILCACGKENQLVAAITPLLCKARSLPGADATVDPCAHLLVNSERISWLDSLDGPLPPDQRKRPDLFATWAPFWSGHLTATGATGKLAARALQLDGCACEFYEAKLGVGELSSADFGQLVDYHSRVRGPVRGMLFNARHFWLLESNRARPLALTKGLLGAPGSLALFRRFFNAGTEPPLLPLLRKLFRELNVVPRRTAFFSGSQDSSVFLGAGGSARVFSVTAADGEPCALKASLLLSPLELHYEFYTMQRAAAAGAPVVPTVPGSLTRLNDASSGEYCGGGFLLRGVCRRVVVSNAALVAEAFAALQELHAFGFLHGDARLPNLLHSEAAGGKMLWVDLREAGSWLLEGGLEAAKRIDANTLAASVLGVRQGGELPEAVQAALDDVPSRQGAYANVAETLRVFKGW